TDCGETEPPYATDLVYSRILRYTRRLWWPSHGLCQCPRGGSLHRRIYQRRTGRLDSGGDLLYRPFERKAVYTRFQCGGTPVWVYSKRQMGEHDGNVDEGGDAAVRGRIR